MRSFDGAPPVRPPLLPRVLVYSFVFEVRFTLFLFPWPWLVPLVISSSLSSSSSSCPCSNPVVYYSLLSRLFFHPAVLSLAPNKRPHHRHPSAARPRRDDSITRRRPFCSLVRECAYLTINLAVPFVSSLPALQSTGRDVPTVLYFGCRSNLPRRLHLRSNPPTERSIPVPALPDTKHRALDTHKRVSSPFAAHTSYIIPHTAR